MSHNKIELSKKDIHTRRKRWLSRKEAILYQVTRAMLLSKSEETQNSRSYITNVFSQERQFNSE